MAGAHDIACLIGIAPWKRKRIRAMLGLCRAVPLARTGAAAVRIAQARGGAIAGWASRLPPDLEELAAGAGVPLYRIEDGFIRSAGLGAALVQPCSLVLDRLGSHYDATRPSELEALLQNHAFTRTECERAEALIDRLRTSGITKYNLGGALPDLPADRPIVLVLGQVDDDLSVQLGGAGATVASMLEAVLAEERDACIVFKPHPDVVAGLRQGVAGAPGCIDASGADLPALFERAERVHVLTSLGGFEALLRGCEVVVHGQPFYAGWGLTRDRQPVSRRTRQLTLPELVAGALIAYPIYFDPAMARRCEVELLLDRLEAQGRAGLPGRLRQWWGRMAQRLRGGTQSAKVETKGQSKVVEQKPIYNIWRVLEHPTGDCEAEIRALCQTAYLGDHQALCRVLGRYKMYVDTRDIGIASHLMLEGYWEMWITQAMMRCVRRGSVVADIGANLGYFTMLLADLTGHEGRVLSFEPNPQLAPLVRKSIAVNGFAGFTDFHEIGLGPERGYAQMDATIDQPGGGRTIPTRFKRGGIRIERLDSIPHADRIEFIKMDVEGFEPNVWQGMTGLLEQGRPLTIFMEFTVGRLADPGGFLDEILSHGFGLEIIHHQHGIVPISREELLGGPAFVDHMLVFRRG